MADLTGQLFAGQYELTKRLGRGGMGTVYLATQVKLKRDVAVKILNTNISDSDIHRTRFEREAETAASLTHPHIVSIFDYGIEGDIHYVAMPYIPGGTLAQRYANIDQYERSTPALHETANVILQIASALDYAHSMGIVHRDVKPSNIMFDKQGNAFLTDFGIARLLATATSFTATGAQIGTPQYMPPEQWIGKTELTQATDQYALAVMTYQLVTGNLPFDGDTVAALMYAHLNEDPYTVQAYRPDLPHEITEVIHKALSKDPTDRYASAGDFARAFDDAVKLITTETPTQFFGTLLESGSGSTSRPASRSRRASQSGSPIQPSQTNAQPKRLLNVVMGIIGIIALIGIGFGLSSALLGGDSPIELTATAIAALPTDTPTHTPTLSRDLVLATADQLVNDEATQTASAWTATPTITETPTLTPTDILPIDQTLTYEASLPIATETSIPTLTSTDTPEPTVLPTLTSTDTPAPTSPPTLTSTDTPELTSTPTDAPTPTEALYNEEWKKGIVRTNPAEFNYPTVQIFKLNTSYPSQDLTLSVRRVTLYSSLAPFPELLVNNAAPLNENTPATVGTNEAGMLEFNVSATSGAGLIELKVSDPLTSTTIQSWVFPVAETVSYSNPEINQVSQQITHDDWKANYAIDLTGDVYFGYANTMRGGYERNAASHPYYVLSTTSVDGRIPVISQVAITSDTFSVASNSITANNPELQDIASDASRTYAAAALEPTVEQTARVVFSIGANPVTIPNIYVYLEPTTIGGGATQWYTGYVAGWVNENYLNLDIQPSSTVTATVIVESANVRQGPNESYPVVVNILQNTPVEIIAVNPAKDWYKINYGDGEGWIYSELVNTQEDINSLPLEDPPPNQ